MWFQSSLQFHNQRNCQVVHVTPNLRFIPLPAWLSGNMPGWVTTLSDCDVAGQRYPDPGHTLVGIWTSGTWHTDTAWLCCEAAVTFFISRHALPLDCIAETLLRNERMCQNELKSTCRLIREKKWLQNTAKYQKRQPVIFPTDKLLVDWPTDVCSECLEGTWRKYC